MATEARAEEPDELKKKLLRRIAVAVVLIAALLGGLSLFDAMMTPQPAKLAGKSSLPEVRSPTEPPAEAKKPEELKPLPGAAVGPEEQKELAKAEPEKTEMPVTPLPPEPPKPAAVPKIPTQPVVPAPAPARATKAISPTPPVPAVAPVKITESPTKAPPPAAKVASTDAKAAEAKLENKAEPKVDTKVDTKPASALAVMRGFVLQMGVFTSTANAEELRIKLEKNGIPASIESHVQVGPFKTRQEAMDAQVKLKALGLGGGMLVPPKK